MNFNICEGSSYKEVVLPELGRIWWHHCIDACQSRCVHLAGTYPAEPGLSTMHCAVALVLQVLGVARRQPEQLHRFLAANDAAQFAESLVQPLAGVLQTTAARSGAMQLSPGFVQDAVYAAAATVAAYGSALLDG